MLRTPDIKDCTKVKKAVQAWNSNILSNHSIKGRNNSKGGRGKGNKRNAGQEYQGHQLAPLFSPTNPTSTRTRTPTSSDPIRTNSNRAPTDNPGRSKLIFPTLTIGHAAAKRAAKSLAASTKGKLKTTTRTTTNAFKPTKLSVTNSDCPPSCPLHSCIRQTHHYFL